MYKHTGRFDAVAACRITSLNRKSDSRDATTAQRATPWKEHALDAWYDNVTRCFWKTDHALTARENLEFSASLENSIPAQYPP